MKRWKIAVLLLSLLLCACGGTQTTSDTPDTPAETEAPALSWDDLAWDEHHRG